MRDQWFEEERLKNDADNKKIGDKKMSTSVSTVDLEEGGGESHAQKTKERLAKWHREHGKQQRKNKREGGEVARKRAKPNEPKNPQREEDCLSDTSNEGDARGFTHAQIEAIRDIVWEETHQAQDPQKEGLGTTVMNAAICTLGALGIGRAALENREAIMDTARGFLGQLGGTESTGRSVATSAVLPSEVPPSTPSPPPSS